VTTDSDHLKITNKSQKITKNHFQSYESLISWVAFLEYYLTCLFFY